MKPDREESPRGFEDVDRDARPELLLTYLDLVGGLAETRAYRARALERLNLRPGDRVLEIGCGLGDNALALAKIVGPGGRIVGIDSSETMIAQARARIPANLPVDFQRGDAHALVFPENSFDACCADRVFQHLEDPERALAEVVRVCRPGGHIVISEPDWETITVDIPDPGLARRALTALCDLVRQGWIGRRLASLFHDATLEDVEVEGSVLVIRSYPLAERLLGLAEAAVRAYESGILPAEDTAAWLAALDRASQEGRFFCSLTGFTAKGKRAPSI